MSDEGIALLSCARACYMPVSVPLGQRRPAKPNWRGKGSPSDSSTMEAAKKAEVPRLKSAARTLCRPSYTSPDLPCTAARVVALACPPLPARSHARAVCLQASGGGGGGDDISVPDFMKGDEPGAGESSNLFTSEAIAFEDEDQWQGEAKQTGADMKLSAPGTPATSAPPAADDTAAGAATAGKAEAASASKSDAPAPASASAAKVSDPNQTQVLIQHEGRDPRVSHASQFDNEGALGAICRGRALPPHLALRSGGHARSAACTPLAAAVALSEARWPRARSCRHRRPCAVN